MPSDNEPLSVDLVAARLVAVRDRIASAGADPDRVSICAVTKGFDVAAVEAARAVGLVDIGENYAQELVAKHDQMQERGRQASEDASVGELRWHMIGRLQRNKVRLLAGRIGCWQSVDRLELGQEIARRDPGARLMVQVNATGEVDKGGFTPTEVEAAVETFTSKGLEVVGLMTVGPTDSSVDPRPAFALTAGLAADLGLEQVSMGMSGDLEAAVAAGSTMVRVGTALFGQRPPASPPPTGSAGRL